MGIAVEVELNWRTQSVCRGYRLPHPKDTLAQEFEVKIGDDAYVFVSKLRKLMRLAHPPILADATRSEPGHIGTKDAASTRYRDNC